MSYFLKRCDSMLAHINLVNKVKVWDIHEDDLRVIQHLVKDGKIKIISDGNFDYYASINAPLYFAAGPIDPVAFHLAAANPANEHFVNVFRKNWYAPELPEYVPNEAISHFRQLAAIDDDLTSPL